MIEVDMSQCKSTSSASPPEEMTNSIDVVSGDDESCEMRDLTRADDEDTRVGNESARKCKKTSFSVDDILSPSKFNGQVPSLAPEYFMRWQPWLMQEALRQNCPFPDLALSFYKPFLVGPKDGK